MCYSWLLCEVVWFKMGYDRYVILDFIFEDNYSMGMVLRGCWIKVIYNKDIVVFVLFIIGFFI